MTDEDTVTLCEDHSNARGDVIGETTDCEVCGVRVWIP